MSAWQRSASEDEPRHRRPSPADSWGTYTVYNDHKIADMFMHLLSERALRGPRCLFMQESPVRLRWVTKHEIPCPPSAQKLARWKGRLGLTTGQLHSREHACSKSQHGREPHFCVHGITSTGICKALQSRCNRIPLTLRASDSLR